MIAPPAPVRVLIADDHTLFRVGLAQILSGFPRIDVVAQARDGAEAVEQSLRHRPDVVLMDLEMPNVSGVEAIHRLREVAPGVRVLLVSAYANHSTFGPALESGAEAYVPKDTTPQEIVTQILAVSDQHAPRRRKLAGLSDRERNVLKQVARGLSNKQIARQLTISEKTVRNHLSRIFVKLRATNRTEAVMNAMRAGESLD